jgi:serine protease
MKTSVLYNALSVLSLWASTTAAQPIALKLSPAGYEKQQADPNFIASLFERARQPNRRSDKVEDLSLGPLANTIEARKVEIKVNPLIKGPGPKRLLARLARTAKRNPAAKTPNFDLWYQVDVDDDDDEDEDETTGNQARSTHNKTPKPPHLSKGTLNLLHRLTELPEVASAHALKAGPPPQANPNDDPRRSMQGYLNAAPQGIDAPYGWEWYGGNGANVTIIDIEQGWNFNHEDLVSQQTHH